MKNDRHWLTYVFACRDDCLDRMAPSDLRYLVRERDTLKAQVAELKAEIANLKAIMLGDGGTDQIILENNNE